MLFVFIRNYANENQEIDVGLEDSVKDDFKDKVIESVINPVFFIPVIISSIFSLYTFLYKSDIIKYFDQTSDDFSHKISNFGSLCFPIVFLFLLLIKPMHEAGLGIGFFLTLSAATLLFQRLQLYNLKSSALEHLLLLCSLKYELLLLVGSSIIYSYISFLSSNFTLLYMLIIMYGFFLCARIFFNDDIIEDIDKIVFFEFVIMFVMVCVQFSSISPLIAMILMPYLLFFLFHIKFFDILKDFKTKHIDN